MAVVAHFFEACRKTPLQDLTALHRGANKNPKAAKRRKKTIDVDTSEVAHVLSRRDVTSTSSLLRERSEFHEARSSSRAVQTNEEVADAVLSAISHREDLGRVLRRSTIYHLRYAKTFFLLSLPCQQLQIRREY
ncbi:hypothetical protein K0M31_004442 [Melipona bicolor]|uniref:Uncharacterized protein n=1 Tax=Melipona bicolor TaxID=60889 RepID=A0AA40FXF3_9HYME|nr:hypothetical protein K0M31_004442 [Melipona bicolor]